MNKNKDSPEMPATTDSPLLSTNKTRISTAWFLAVSLILGLMLLLIFILQNLSDTYIKFFGFHWKIPLGIAMLLAAVVGGLLLALFGTARVVQLGHRLRRNDT